MYNSSVLYRRQGSHEEQVPFLSIQKPSVLPVNAIFQWVSRLEPLLLLLLLVAAVVAAVVAADTLSSYALSRAARSHSVRRLLVTNHLL